MAKKCPDLIDFTQCLCYNGSNKKGDVQMKIARYWNGLSIRIKAVITQLVMIIVPLCICLFLIVQQITTENRMDNALTTYQHNNSVIQMLDTNVRQMESLVNTLAGNKSVRQYVSMEPGEESDALYQEHISNLLHYSYNRYLPTHDIQILQKTTLNDLSIQGEVTHVRSANRLWTFTSEDGQILNNYFYQFTGEQYQPGVIACTISPNMLVDTLTTIASINEQLCAIYDLNGEALYLPEGADQAMMQQLALNATEGYSVMDNNHISYCVRSEMLPLLFVSVQKVDNMWRYWKEMLPLFAVFLLLVAGCVFLSYQTLFSGITRRILKLTKACEGLSLGAAEEFSVGALSQAETPDKPAVQLAVPILGVDEIGRLSASINDMLVRITELTRISEQEAMLSQRAAYDMLAAQIHPHFIYNTLENLRMMAEVNDDDQVADLLYALGRMLRLSISDQTSTGEISMEIEHVQTYLLLQQMRMNGKLEYQIDPVDPAINSVKCPRFLLQPVVENAIKHGFSGNEKTGRIHITSGKYDKGIFLRVTDSGVGLTQARQADIAEALKNKKPISNTQGGIGLANVHARLQMFYGPEAGLTLESEPGQGTVCTLWLPTCL